MERNREKSHLNDIEEGVNPKITKDETASEMTSKRALETEKLCADAILLYRSSNLSLKEVAEVCDLNPVRFISHISKYHRTMILDRYGLDSDILEFDKRRIILQTGQREATLLKYKRAIKACIDIAYLEFNVMQIARLFKVNGSALAAQLKIYYPEIINEREALRKKIGIASRGPRPGITENYLLAFHKYCASEMSLSQVAKECNVSRCGFARFMKCYHNDIVQTKEMRRKEKRRRMPAII